MITLDDPGAFGVEHNDAMAVRDLGWHLYWVATAQEALDMALIAWKVAEDPRVLLPFALSCDGSFLTHSQAIVQVPSQDLVKKFLPDYKRGTLQLHPDNPITVAPQVNEDWLMEIRKQTDEAMRRTSGVIKEAYEEFREIFGRGDPSPFIEEFMCEDAEIILVGMGTLAMPTRVAVRRRVVMLHAECAGVVQRAIADHGHCTGGALSRVHRGADQRQRGHRHRLCPRRC